METCRFVVLRSPRGRLGSGLDMCNRLRRMRGRFIGGYKSVQVLSTVHLKRFEFGERTDTAIWHARLRAVDRREYTGPRPRSEKRAAIEQRQRA